MDKLIIQLDNWLSENRADYYSSLLPGATDEEFSSLEDQLSLSLPDDLRALYRWRNGQHPSEFASFQDNRMFLSLRQISETKDTLDGMIGYDFDDPKWWRRGWIPFLSNGGGDYLCVDVSAEDGGAPGQLIAFWHDDGDREVEFSSLTEWLGALVDSMGNGTVEFE